MLDEVICFGSAGASFRARQNSFVLAARILNFTARALALVTPGAPCYWLLPSHAPFALCEPFQALQRPPIYCIPNKVAAVFPVTGRLLAWHSLPTADSGLPFSSLREEYLAWTLLGPWQYCLGASPLTPFRGLGAS